MPKLLLPCLLLAGPAAALLASPRAPGLSAHPAPLVPHSSHRTHPPQLFASPSPPGADRAAAAKERGFYARPSAAVERGGGFYVPGLEGYKWRLAVASVLTLALALNRALSPGEPAASQLVSEVLGASGCVFLLVQVVLERDADAIAAEDNRRARTISRLETREEFSADLTPLEVARARWLAASLVRLTAASAVVLVRRGGGWGGEVLMLYGQIQSERSDDLAVEVSAIESRLAGASAVCVPQLESAEAKARVAT